MTFGEAPTTGAQIRVVARLLGPSFADRAEEPDYARRSYEATAARFDQVVLRELRDREPVLSEAITDSLGPGATVLDLSIGVTNSVELVAFVTFSWHVLKNFDDVIETLAHTRDHIESIVRKIVAFSTGYPDESYTVVGAFTPYPPYPLPQNLLYPSQPTPYAGPVLIPRRPRGFSTRQPCPRVKWDRDVWLTRLVVPLLYAFAAASLLVGLLAAWRHL